VAGDAAADDAPGADAAAEAALDAMLPVQEVAGGGGLPRLLPPPAASSPSLSRAEPTVDADRAAELAFAALDADGDGYVCAADLVAAAAATGAPAMTAADAAATIADADADGDGRLTFDEFKAAIWRGKSKGGGGGGARRGGERGGRGVTKTKSERPLPSPPPSLFLSPLARLSLLLQFCNKQTHPLSDGERGGAHTLWQEKSKRK
jgi:hypothetical protein